MYVCIYIYMYIDYNIYIVYRRPGGAAAAAGDREIHKATVTRQIAYIDL